MTKKIITTSPKKTKSVARAMLKDWLKTNKRINLIICLNGALGAGKTTFVQGLSEELGIKETVTSPTFTIMKKYTSTQSIKKKYSLYHFDCYRISDYRDILDLGWEEIIHCRNSIIAVEWPNKIKKIMAVKNKIDVKFKFSNVNNSRIIEIEEID